MTKAVFLVRCCWTEKKGEVHISCLLPISSVLFHLLNATDIQLKGPIGGAKEENRHFVQGDETGRLIHLPTGIIPQPTHT